MEKERRKKGREEKEGVKGKGEKCREMRKKGKRKVREKENRDKTEEEVITHSE